MNWNEVRQAYPAQWLFIEALEAKTLPDRQRELERIAVIEKCADGLDAMNKYRRLHQQYPRREFYFVHTARESLDIEERRWLGIRTAPRDTALRYHASLRPAPAGLSPQRQLAYILQLATLSLYTAGDPK